MKILACNAGSTSLKFRLYEMPEEKELLAGKIEKIGTDRSIISYQYDHVKECFVQTIDDFLEGVRIAVSVIAGSGVINTIEDLKGIAFKTVHGGYMRESCIIDEKVLAVLDEYQVVAPLHNRVYGEVIRAFQKLVPSCTLVAAFETAFHKDMPEYVKHYSVPYEWKELYGIQRYGFHGASHGYINKRIQQLMKVEDIESFNVISCHLGGSSSLCPIKGGVSIGATQGFSPQSGIAMGTRVGDLDAYALLYLLKKGFTFEQLDEALFHESGLKGLSGISDDVRDLEEAASTGDRRAALALEVYCYDVKRYIGQCLTVLGNTDAIIMTGGIGENSINLRKKILSGMEQLGIVLDSERNAANIPESLISADNSKICIYVIPTNEEVMVAQEAYGAIVGKECGL